MLNSLSWVMMVVIGFIQWTTEQIELFANLFKRQLDGQTDPQDLEDSLNAMRLQSKRVSLIIEPRNRPMRAKIPLNVAPPRQ